MPESLIFARNNVFVYLSEQSSGQGPAAARESAVRRFARLLDSQLASRSFNGPALLQPRLSAGGFDVAVATAAGPSYVLETKDSLTDAGWTAHPPFTGDGTIRALTIPASPRQRFLRLRVE